MLHSFGSANDGEQPPCGLMEAANKYLYGVTYYGGTGGGTIYKYGPI